VAGDISMQGEPSDLGFRFRGQCAAVLTRGLRGGSAAFTGFQAVADFGGETRLAARRPRQLSEGVDYQPVRSTRSNMSTK